MIKNLLTDDDDPAPRAEANPTPAAPSSNSVLSLFDAGDRSDKEPFTLSDDEPKSMAESVRQSGLAYSAGIALFAAVVFMMIVGWGADLLLGTSPWGIVGGIVVGSIIGFIQFFRLTSQIFKK